jgi:hypothetical protein
MRTVVCRVEQQHNRDRRQCNRTTKIRSTVCAILDKRFSPKTRKPPERSSPGASWIVEIRYIRQSNDTELSQSRHLIVCSMWPQCVASVILFSRKAAGSQLAFVPIGSRQRRSAA